MHKVLINDVEYVENPDITKPTTLTQEEARMVSWHISEKGFDYTFHAFSDFERSERTRVRCQRFHQLRERYLQARNELAELLESKGGEA